MRNLWCKMRSSREVYGKLEESNFLEINGGKNFKKGGSSVKYNWEIK